MQHFRTLKEYRKSTPRSSSCCLFSLSLITLFLSLARTLLENFPRTESRGAIFSRGGLERKGKERGDYSFTGRWIDLTWMEHTHSLSLSLSLSEVEGKKRPKKNVPGGWTVGTGLSSRRRIGLTL